MTARPQRPALGWVAFAAAALLSVIVVLVISRDAVFNGDEWGILLRLARDPLPTALFEAPPGKYLIAIPIALYGLIAEIFGADSYLPFRILGIALTMLAAGLLFAYARRRVSEAVALPCAILLLFLGAAWEVVAIPGRVPSQIAICAGLAMLLMLDRRDRGGDIAACAFGVIAVLSHPVGVGFSIAAALLICLGRPRGWTKSWVFAIPLLVYAAWSLTLSKPIEDPLPTSFSEVTSFAWDTFVALCATVTGIFRPPWTDAVDFSTAAARVIAVLALIALVVAVVRARRLSLGLAAALVLILFDLVAPGLAPGNTGFLFRMPEAPRYIYPGVVLLLVVVVEVVALRKPWGRSPTAAAVAAVAAVVFAIGLFSNVAQLFKSADAYSEASKLQTATYGAYVLTRDGRTPAEMADDQGVTLEESYGALVFILGAPDAKALASAAPAYFVVADKFGAPADSVEEIRAASPFARQRVDGVLVSAVPVRLRPGRSAVPADKACRQVRPLPGDGPGSTSLRVPPGSLTIDSGPGPPPKLALGRFWEAPSVPVRWPRAARQASVSLAETGAPEQGWSVEVDRPVRLTYCDPAAGAG